MRKLPPLFKAAGRGGKIIWEIWVTRTSEGYGAITVRYGKVDGKLQETTDVVKKGKNVGKANETSPYEQACAEAESKWTKQLNRRGYGRTVEASAAVRGVSAMLAQSYDDQSAKVDWGTAFAQPKLDGFRCLAHVDESGSVRLVSRENQPLTVLEKLGVVIRESASYFRSLGLSTVSLDGEIYCHGMSLNQISSACKKLSEATDKLEYHLYDLAVPGLSFKERSAALKQFLSRADSERLHRVETVKVRSDTELMQCQSEFLLQGFEGAMLRHGNGGYDFGKRSAALLKVKTFVDGEFEVVDWKMGRGRYAGMPVFTCQTAAGDLFDVLTEGTLDEKRALGKIADQMVGRKMTVKYQYLTKTKNPVPFFPVGKGFRDGS
jgi:DNA ligase 1